MLVSNATVDVAGNIDFGIASDYSNADFWDESAMLTGGSYTADFLDGAGIKAKRLFVGRDRENVTLTFDGATFTSRADASDFIMQDVRTDAPFVVTNEGLTVVSGHSTALKAHFRGTGGITKQGSGELAVYYDQYFTGALTCDAGTIGASDGVTFAAGSLVMNGGTANLSGASFTNSAVALTLNGGTMHVFDGGTIKTQSVGNVTFGAGFAFHFDVSSDGTDAFAIKSGSTVTVDATATNPFVLTPNIISNLPGGKAFKVFTGCDLTSDDLSKFSCSTDSYRLGIDSDGDLTVRCADSVYAGGSSGNWSGSVWGDAEGGHEFVSGDNAIFSSDGDSVTLDASATAEDVIANENATIAESDWSSALTKYSRYRFHISATRSNDSMMQLSEIELFSGTSKMTPSSISYDATTYSDFVNFPDGEAPKYAVDGTTSTKWLDRRGGNGRSSEVRANCYIELIYEA